jgi:hypothetical protein
MLSVRYVAGKVWLNFICAIVGGLVAVIVIGSLWDRTALIGGFAGMIAVLALLLPGAIQRTTRTQPILAIDGRGVTVELLGVGTIPWAQLRSSRIGGVPWVTGQRLVLEYTGTAPKVGFMSKLNWGMQSKQRGDTARLTIGFIEQTDQPKQAVEAALSRISAQAA